MRYSVLAVAVIVVSTLAGCSSHAATTVGRAAATTHSASTVGSSTALPPAASPGATGHPLAFYAAQYLADGKACMAAQDVLHKLPNDATDAQAQAAATNVVTACQAANAAALRQEWPANVMADLRAEVTADGPVFGDLADLVDNVDNLARDSGAANAAANLVRADLGLPPLS